MSISVLIATIGKPTLLQMIDSLKNQLSNTDHLYIIVDGEQYFDDVRKIVSGLDFDFDFNVIYESNNLGYWGHGIRNKYQGNLKGDYIIHGDDDDIYLSNAISDIKTEIVRQPNKLLFFRFNDRGNTFWRVPALQLDNIGTPCGVIPNEPNKMGQWGYRYGGDFDFYNTCKFEYLFIDKTIYQTRP